MICTTPSQRGRGKGSAFTIIEIMLAIAIFSLVLVAIYASWSAILRASQAGLKAAGEAQRMRVTLRALKESLGAVQLFAGNLAHYGFVTDTSGEFASLSFVAKLPPSFPGSGLFGDLDVRRVTFMVEEKGGTNQLVLLQSPLLQPTEMGDEPYRLVLAPHVNLFAAEFWETNANEWLPEWLPTNQLPRLVRIGLSVEEPGQRQTRREEIAIQAVLVASAAIPREMQFPAARGGLAPAPIAPPSRTIPGRIRR